MGAPVCAEHHDDAAGQCIRREKKAMIAGTFDQPLPAAR